ncbi:MAG: lamin tail domain-containing protein [Proteobacteria bacterium]|nr:lamin tail domain-containing protein [Pseudomonadota bacterium]MBU1057704.1 lamin tail domain-containing protein [Pseudomonadota bacterium]
MDIYQKIWDADQSESGVVPMLDTESGDSTIGYVKVNSNLNTEDQSLRALPEAIIPDSKRRTYDLCRELFDNFALPERDEENDTPEEREEVHDLVHAMVDTAPMQVARDYVAQATGTSITRERWYNTLMEMWFRKFSQGGDPHLSGFEHVVVGEQEGAKAKGYHFWYKYYLDDGFARLVDDAQAHFPGLVDDRIVYLGAKQGDSQAQFPESITISYRWHAPDYDRESLRPLTKPIGGFFVGCSVEGLLALGSVRAHLGARAPKQGVINGAKYDLKLFRSDNNRHIRTFYPSFIGPADSDNGGNGDTTQVSAGMIRIIAALINPKGHDPGYETVTLINTGDTIETLNGWRLEDKNGRFQSLDSMVIGAGDSVRIRLDPQGAQLSNNGGQIRVVNTNGLTIHTVTYSKGQIKTDGQTILF